MTTKKKNRLSQKNYTINVCKNGPYLVSGRIPLIKKIIKYDSNWDSCEWQDDKTLPIQDTYTLCRFGKSKNKLFCDSSHYPE